MAERMSCTGPVNFELTVRAGRDGFAGSISVHTTLPAKWSKTASLLRMRFPCSSTRLVFWIPNETGSTMDSIRSRNRRLNSLAKNPLLETSPLKMRVYDGFDPEAAGLELFLGWLDGLRLAENLKSAISIFLSKARENSASEISSPAGAKGLAEPVRTARGG